MPKNHINIGITILIPLLYEGSFSKIAKSAFLTGSVGVA